MEAKWTCAVDKIVDDKISRDFALAKEKHIGRVASEVNVGSIFHTSDITRDQSIRV